MQIPESRGRSGAGRVSSQRGLLCHIPAPALGLPSVSLAWRDTACPSGFPWKRVGRVPLSFEPPRLPIAPLTRSNTHTLRALLRQGFPSGQITL